MLPKTIGVNRRGRLTRNIACRARRINTLRPRAASKADAGLHSMAFALACWYARRNDKDAAFKWLERSYDNHEPMITMIKSPPELRPLHSDPRYAALLQKLKLPN